VVRVPMNLLFLYAVVLYAVVLYAVVRVPTNHGVKTRSGS
jgi:hypothetical protein